MYSFLTNLVFVALISNPNNCIPLDDDNSTLTKMILEADKALFMDTSPKKGTCFYKRLVLTNVNDTGTLEKHCKINFYSSGAKYRLEMSSLLDEKDLDGKVIPYANRSVIIFDGDSSIQGSFADSGKFKGSSGEIIQNDKLGRAFPGEYGIGMRPDRPYGLFFTLSKPGLVVDSIKKQEGGNSSQLTCTAHDEHSCYVFLVDTSARYRIVDVKKSSLKKKDEVTTRLSFKWGTDGKEPMVRSVERMTTMKGNGAMSHVKHIVEYSSFGKYEPVDEAKFTLKSLELTNGAKIIVRNLQTGSSEVMFFNSSDSGNQSISNSINSLTKKPIKIEPTPPQEYYSLLLWSCIIAGALLIMGGAVLMFQRARFKTP